jgi:hypothetical protein
VGQSALTSVDQREVVEARCLEITAMVNAFQSWLRQIQHLIEHKFNTMSPQDYCIMLVLCISIGFVLLRGKS